MKYYILVETITPTSFYSKENDVKRYFVIYTLNKKQKETLNEESLKSNILVEANTQAEALRLFNKKLDFIIYKDANVSYQEVYLPQV